MAGTARLIVLGSGTAVPRADRATSCYLVDDGQGALLVDLGPGALHRAAAAGYPLERLRAVLVTHVHPDHCADLIHLLFALRNTGVRQGCGPLPVYGHASLGLLVARLRNAWRGWLEARPERVSLRSVSPGPLLDLPGSTRITAHSIAHHASSLGYRLTLADGQVVAFSGDATEGADLQGLGRDADLLVLEAASPQARPIPGHLTPLQAGQIAAACRARHLVATHFYPEVLDEPILERIQETFEGRVTLAEDGMVLPLAPPATLP